jgi:hypothetical protein
MQIRPPAVILTGGLLASDVLPPFDDDARFYVAPPPLGAIGGMLAVCNAGNSAPEALERLARLWLVPGTGGQGMLLLRTGERVEVPWGAAVVVFATASEVPAQLAAAVPYQVDASRLGERALRRFLARRLPTDSVFTPAAIDSVARMLEGVDLQRRQSAAAIARYLRDRSAYQGPGFSLTGETMSNALQFAAARHAPREPAKRAA